MNKLVKQAFTLIELLVVIAIIGILSGLIIVGMNGMTNKATIAKSQVFSNSLRNALMANLVSEWRFDDITDYDPGTKIIGLTANNIPDMWGVNEGTAYGDMLLKDGSDCVSGKCLELDGSGDYVNCGVSSSLDFGNGTIDTPFTLSGWFKISDTTSAGIMGKFGSSSQYLFWTSGSDVLYFALYDNSNSAYIGRSCGAITGYENKWIYLVATYDGSANISGIKTYINGTRVDDTNYSNGTYVAMESLSVVFKIGTYNVQYMTGYIDDVRVYSAAVPTSLIKEQYYAGINNLLANKQINAEEYSQRINSIAKR